MLFANFDFDEMTPQILKDASRSLNSNRKLGSNYFKATGLDISDYLDSIPWTGHDKDVFELGLYVALETTKKATLDTLKGMLKFP